MPRLGGGARTAVVASSLLLFIGATCGRGDGEPDELVIFAAASLKDVLTEVAEPFEAQADLATVFNFAGSNVLAMQIEAAPAADVYVSASEQWMDYLDERGLLVPGSRRIFLANRLVVIANVGREVELAQLSDLADLDFRYLSLADPAAVPAGRYAREFLSNVRVDGIDLWEILEPRLAPAPDVRAALAMVEAHPDVVGVVYETDAESSSRVRTLVVVPEPPAPRVRYSAAAIRGRSSQAASFLDFLASEAAGSVFEAHGFARRSEDG